MYACVNKEGIFNENILYTLNIIILPVYINIKDETTTRIILPLQAMRKEVTDAFIVY